MDEFHTQDAIAEQLGEALGRAHVSSGERGTRQSFYEQVYAFVREVPPGRVVTYGQVALELGSPSAARAVGYALHFLPLDNDVPWWRVVNASGAISQGGRGPSAALQRERLEAEGVCFDFEGKIRLREFRWQVLSER